MWRISSRRWPRLEIAATAVVVAIAGMAAYTVTVSLRGSDESVGAARGADPRSVLVNGRPVSLEPLSQTDIPDTSVPNWERPFKDEESARPRYAQTINGISLDPADRGASSSPCAPGEAKYIDADVGQSSPLAIDPDALPDRAQLDTSLFYEDIECGGRVILSSRFYVVPMAEDAAERIQAGVSWFEVEHGGRIWVQRYFMEAPRWNGSEVPSEQWEAAMVAGLPAAVARPTLPGFSFSSVVVWNAETNTLTAIRASDRPIEEVLAVAAGVVQ